MSERYSVKHQKWYRIFFKLYNINKIVKKTINGYFKTLAELYMVILLKTLKKYDERNITQYFCKISDFWMKFLYTEK